MKKTIVVLACTATIHLFMACGNGSETTTAKSDTTASDDKLVTERTSTSKDTAKTGNALMQAMNDMVDKIQSGSMNGDFDKDWANMMKVYHQGAIDIAQTEISQGKDETMKAMAQKVISEQTDEQNKLKAIQWEPTAMKPDQSALQKSIAALSDTVKSLQLSGNIDKDFTTLMAFHYENGIVMSKLELKNGTNTEVKQIAQKSMENQQKTAKEFQQWLSAHQ